MREFKSPKKQRKSAAGSANLEQKPAQQRALAEGEVAEAVGGDAEQGGTVTQHTGSPLEPVSDAARAFRQLRVRPAMVGIEHSRAGSPVAQPRSPKKRKASVNIDKEFILKDEKVKRSTDQQGDISQARGILGQLLFEFGQLELNKDLLDAIKRTESRTGLLCRASGRQEVDRIAFEYVVAEAADLLHTQMATVAAHTEDANVQTALLRAYAVQAIATFADEDGSSSDEDNGEEEDGYVSGDRSPSPCNPHHQQLQDMQHSNETSQEDAGVNDEREGEEVTPRNRRSQSVDMTRAGSVTPMPSFPATRLAQQAEHAQQQPFGHTSQQQASGSEQVSSSVLPDALTEAALEDTAAQQLQQASPHSLQSAGMGDAACTGDHAQQPDQPQHEGQSRDGHSTDVGEDLTGGSQAQADQISGLDDVMQQLSDAVDEMLRSPDAVTSRPRVAAPWAAQTGPQLVVLPPVGEQGELSSHEIEGRQRLHKAQPALTDHGLHPLPQPAGAATAATEEAPQLSKQQRQQRQQALQRHAIEGDLAGVVPAHQQQQRLHYHPHRPLRAQHHRQHLPALQEEGSSRGVTDGPAGAGVPALASSRLPLRALSPQQVQQHSGSNSGSGGTQQSDAHVEALKRQRTSTGDERPQIIAQPAGHDRHWAQQAVDKADFGEATSPLFNQQARDGYQQQEQRQLAGPAQLTPQLPAAQGGDGSAELPANAEEQAAEKAPAGVPGEGSLETHAARCGSSVWGSTLVCADLTVNDVASKYWPFLRSAMQGQNVVLQEDDVCLVASLVQALGDTVDLAYTAESGGRRPSAETKSLIAATAFDDMFRDKFAQESSGASK